MANEGSATGSEFYSAAEDMSDHNISLTSDNETRQALKAWTGHMTSTDSDLSSITINDEANLSLSLNSPEGVTDKTVVFQRGKWTASTDTESNLSFVSAVSSQHTPTGESHGEHVLGKLFKRLIIQSHIVSLLYIYCITVLPSC